MRNVNIDYREETGEYFVFFNVGYEDRLLRIYNALEDMTSDINNWLRLANLPEGR